MLRAHSQRLPRLLGYRSGDGARRCLSTQLDTDAETSSQSQSTTTYPPNAVDLLYHAKLRYNQGVARVRKAYRAVSRMPRLDQRPTLYTLERRLARTLRQITDDALRDNDAKTLSIVGSSWRQDAKARTTGDAWGREATRETKTGIKRGIKAVIMGETKRDSKEHVKEEVEEDVKMNIKQSVKEDVQREESQRPTSAKQPSTQPTYVTSKPTNRSLLEELFPDVKSHNEPLQTTKTYPKLNPPNPEINQPIGPTPPPKSYRSQMMEAFMKKGEQTTALQLVNCSTELTEADFRRMIPRGQHIDTWFRDGEFYKVIPGRDPLSLERLPFYYLLFKTPEAALAYQKNVSRLHKLSGLHQSSDILSAVSLPRGFLEEGEDVGTAVSSYYLVPTNHELRLNTVMQPYNPMLRALIANGGYKPIVPDVDAKGQRIYKVLMYIEGYEPSTNDLWHILTRHARDHGITWPFLNDHISAILRLRDIVNLKTKFQAVSAANPRSVNASLEANKVDFEDAAISMHYSSSEPDDNPTQMNQLIMNRVYNRWVIEFEEEDAARRFATMWHRKVLPDPVKDSRNTTWRETEERRICNAEFLW